MDMLDELREQMRNETEPERRERILALQPPEMRKHFAACGAEDDDPFAVPNETDPTGEGVQKLVPVDCRATSVLAMDAVVELGAAAYCDEWGFTCFQRPRRPQDAEDRPVVDLKSEETTGWLALQMYHRARKPLKKREMDEALTILTGEAYENMPTVELDCLVEREPVLEAILALLQPTKAFSGTAGELLGALQGAATQNNIEFGKHALWPKDSTRLSQQIHRLHPWFSELGVHYEYRRTRSRRVHTLRWTADWEGEPESDGRGTWEEAPELVSGARDASDADKRRTSVPACSPSERTDTADQSDTSGDACATGAPPARDARDAKVEGWTDARNTPLGAKPMAAIRSVDLPFVGEVACGDSRRGASSPTARDASDAEKRRTSVPACSLAERTDTANQNHTSEDACATATPQTKDAKKYQDVLDLDAEIYRRHASRGSRDLFKLAVRQADDGDRKGAIPLLQLLTQREDARGIVFHCLAESLLDEGQLEPAVQAATRAVELVQSSEECSKLLFEALCRSGRHKAAVEEMARYLSREGCTSTFYDERIEDLQRDVSPCDARDAENAAQKAGDLETVA